MPVEFTVRTDDFKRAFKQLRVNRAQFADSDFAELKVQPSVVEFRAVGTTTAIAADGRQAGEVRLPLKVLERIVEVAKSHKREVTVVVENGFAQIGRVKTSHPDISLGAVTYELASIPTNASALDTLAVASMMTPEQIVDSGLRDRVEKAQKAATQAVGSAVAALREFEVTNDEITTLIENRVALAAELIKRAVKE